MFRDLARRGLGFVFFASAAWGSEFGVLALLVSSFADPWCSEKTANASVPFEIFS